MSKRSRARRQRRWLRGVDAMLKTWVWLHAFSTWVRLAEGVNERRETKAFIRDEMDRARRAPGGGRDRFCLRFDRLRSGAGRSPTI